MRENPSSLRERQRHGDWKSDTEQMREVDFHNQILVRYITISRLPRRPLLLTQKSHSYLLTKLSPASLTALINRAAVVDSCGCTISSSKFPLLKSKLSVWASADHRCVYIYTYESLFPLVFPYLYTNICFACSNRNLTPANLAKRETIGS